MGLLSQRLVSEGFGPLDFRFSLIAT
jgi:hypothetical protein